MGELRQRLKETFDREGIVIPHLTLSTTPVVTAKHGDDGAE
jgi:hypothetical protein